MTFHARHLLLAASAALGSSAHAAIPLEACNNPSFQTVLHASSASHDARAVWLDRRLAKWPGADANAVFRLYHSPTGAIVARPGRKVGGAAGALALANFVALRPQTRGLLLSWVGRVAIFARSSLTCTVAVTPLCLP